MKSLLNGRGGEIVFIPLIHLLCIHMYCKYGTKNFHKAPMGGNHFMKLFHSIFLIMAFLFLYYITYKSGKWERHYIVKRSHFLSVSLSLRGTIFGAQTNKWRVWVNIVHQNETFISWWSIDFQKFWANQKIHLIIVWRCIFDSIS